MRRRCRPRDLPPRCRRPLPPLALMRRPTMAGGGFCPIAQVSHLEIASWLLCCFVQLITLLGMHFLKVGRSSCSKRLHVFLTPEPLQLAQASV